MRPSLLALLFAVSASPALAVEPCEIDLRSSTGHDIVVKYVISGQPSRAGSFKVEDFTVDFFGVPAQQNVRLELTDVHAHGLTELNQSIIVNFESPYTTGTTAHSASGKLATTANNSQELSIKVGDSYLIDPINGTKTFRFNFGEHLWDGLCTL